ncbi:MAG: hypothetical protein FWG79_06215 [Bacteroidales bacterium]|nr:hypothetical protein [Bacteroidales bacterium]
MKKLFYLPIIIGLMATGFAGCNKNDNPPTISTESFFTIEDAIFHKTGNLPSGSTPLINGLTINGTVITGGSTIISFSSPEKIKTAYISVKGISGYFQYDFYDALSSKSAKSIYDYDLVLLISQNLDEQDFVIEISCLSESGEYSIPVSTGNITVVEVGTGILQVSLAWDQFDDLDLHLLEPNGNKIYYGDPFALDPLVDEDELWFLFYCHLVTTYTSHDASSLKYTNEDDRDILDDYLDDLWNMDMDESIFYWELNNFFAEWIVGGWLDMDSNPGCWIDSVNNENITYKNEPKAGVYYVAVDLYSKCDNSKPGAKYSVTVNYKGQTVTISDKQVGQFTANDEGSYDSPGEYHIIGAFTIDASGIKPAQVTGNPFANYYPASRNAPSSVRLDKFKNSRKKSK